MENEDFIGLFVKVLCNTPR